MTKLKIKKTYVSGLFDKPSLFTKNKIKVTPIRAVTLIFTFVWNAWEIEDHAKIFTEFRFPKIVY